VSRDQHDDTSTVASARRAGVANETYGNAPRIGRSDRTARATVTAEKVGSAQTDQHGSRAVETSAGDRQCNAAWVPCRTSGEPTTVAPVVTQRRIHSAAHSACISLSLSTRILSLHGTDSQTDGRPAPIGRALSVMAPRRRSSRRCVVPVRRAPPRALAHPTRPPGLAASHSAASYQRCLSVALP